MCGKWAAGTYRESPRPEQLIIRNPVSLCSMCHHRDAHDWTRKETEEEATDEPSALDEEPAGDVELLTDGGE